MACKGIIIELIPARVRGTVDLIISGSFWVGTAPSVQSGHWSSLTKAYFRQVLAGHRGLRRERSRGWLFS